MWIQHVFWCNVSCDCVLASSSVWIWLKQKCSDENIVVGAAILVCQPETI